MIVGAICEQEYGIGSNNLFREAHNFNYLQDWFKSSGGGNANISNDLFGRHSYSGIGAVKIDFTGTSQVTFNMGTVVITAGATQLARTIQKDGIYVLSYAFDKSDPTADITIIIDMFVNGSLAESRKIEQNLYNTSGFIDGKWNIYFQNFALLYGNVVDFQIRAQSDTTGVQVYFDRFKLEIADKGVNQPTLYSEAPLDIIVEENEVPGFTLADGDQVTITGSITGARVNDSNRSYVLIKYPAQYINLGLKVHTPVITDDNVVKTIISNNTGADVEIDDGVINYRIVRQ